MRLWHHQLLPYLPKGQLLAQWRELNSIYAKEDRHILINYIYEYPKQHLFFYSNLVIAEMKKRNYQIRTINKYENYFSEIKNIDIPKLFEHHHDDEYLTICYYNLKEKFIRGQKDYPDSLFQALQQFYIDTMERKKEH